MNLNTILNVLDAVATANQPEPQKFPTNQNSNRPAQKQNWYEYGDDYSNESGKMKNN